MRYRTQKNDEDERFILHSPRGAPINTTTNLPLSAFSFAVVSGCYFPIEYQGSFLIQTQASRTESKSSVSYFEVTVEADAIPPWGRCHRRRGNHVILKDSSGPEDCMRCFHLSMKTPNVIQLHTIEGLEKCYTNEEAARATCPQDKDVQERRHDKNINELILYRKWPD